MKCMVCGNKVGNNDNICTNCGSNLKSQREATFTSVNTIPISNPQNNKQNNGAGKAILIIFLLFFILPMLLPFVMVFMEIGDFFDEIEENIPEVSTRCEEEVNDPYGYWISDNNNYFSINGDQTLYYYDNYYDLTNNKLYKVCIGAYKNKANADKILDEAKSKGFKDSYIIYE